MITICEDINNIPKEFKRTVLVIGNLDGVHLGHKYLLQEAKKVADKLNSKLAVMTFTPHPLELFSNGSIFFHLSSNSTKFSILESLGVDIVFNVHFDIAFKNITANDFIYKILIKELEIKHLFVGDDFTFGFNKVGNIDLLKGKGFGFSPITRLSINDEIISSSLIRKSIREGKVEAAAAYLGNLWHIEGAVLSGKKRDALAGLATANQNIEPYISPKEGLYATRVLIDGDSVLRDAITIIDTNVKTPVFKTHILDFSKELYGQNMKLFFVKTIRNERYNVDDITKEDCQAAKIILSNLDK